MTATTNMTSTSSDALPQDIANIMAAISVKDAHAALAKYAMNAAVYWSVDTRKQWDPYLDVMISANGVGPNIPLKEALKKDGIDTGPIIQQIMAITPSIAILPRPQPLPIEDVPDFPPVCDWTNPPPPGLHGS